MHQGGGGGDRRDDQEDDDDPPLPPHLPPFEPDNPTASLPTSLDSIPEAAWATLGLNDSDVIALERRLLDFSTSRKLSSSQRAMLDHCTTITAEAISAASSQVAARYYALFHLLPRMLVTETSLRRAKASAPRPYWSQGRKKQQQRHRHASSTHEDTIFRSRCYAFLTGNWAPLLTVHASARRITHATDDKKLSLDILALVHGGQLSRAMARADAMALAAPVASTIAALRALHPPDDHALHPDSSPPPPICDYAPPDPPLEPLSRTHFHEVWLRKLPKLSAADHGGWRYEYLSSAYRFLSTTRPDAPPGAPTSFIPGRGADALFNLASTIFDGHIPASVRPWFLGGRLIALSKDGDDPSLDETKRKLRPIAIGSTLGRAVSMVVARQYKDRFAAYLQPPPPGSSNPPAQPNGAPWPAQVGVACSSGLEFTTHSVRAVLDENPSWIDVALDAKNAFNSIHRRTFLKVISDTFPSLWSWVWSNYGEPTELYVRRDNLAPEIIKSRSGTRQGCPLGAQLFAIGLHPVLCLIQSLLGERGMLIAYCDDIHILCPPHVANEILLLVWLPPPLPPPARPTPNPLSLTPLSSPRASNSDQGNNPFTDPPYRTRPPACE